MLGDLWQWMDRIAIQAGCRHMARDGRWPPRREQAKSLLLRDDFFPEPSPVINHSLAVPGNFAFPSAIRTSWTRTDTVYGWMRTGTVHWREQPNIILLHGLQGELVYRWNFRWWARALADRDVTVWALQLPFHGLRRPSGPGQVSNFLSSDLVATLNAARQSVTDVRTLLRWLAGQGVTRTGLVGVSLGGWVAGMTGCLEDGLSVLGLVTPMVHVERAFRELAFCEPVRRAMGSEALDISPLNLENRTPRLAPSKILILEAQYDQLVPGDTLESLSRRWEGLERWPVPHGHISILFSWPVIRRTAQWLARAAHGSQ